MISFIDKWLAKKLKHNQYLPIQIDITNACNLKCKHCYHDNHSNVGNLILEDWFKILRNYKTLIIDTGFQPYFFICGGEPTISTHFFPILNFIAENFQNSTVKILSNGIRINENMCEKLLSIKNIGIKFQISIDGSTKEKHDFFRGTGSFNKSIDAIKLLIKKSISVDLACVLSKSKVDELPNYFDLAKNLNVEMLSFNRLITNGTAKQMVTIQDDKPLDKIELKKAYQDIFFLSLKKNVNVDLHKPLMHLTFPGLGGNSKFWQSIIIDYKGNILASSRSRLIIGNALTDGLTNVFYNNPLMKKLRRKKISGCQNCEDIKICGGDRNAAYAEYGDLLAADPGCWKFI